MLGCLLNRNEKPEIGDLSARGREILEMVVDGLSNAEIAGRLYLSASTIKQHLRAVYKVLRVRNKRATKPSARKRPDTILSYPYSLECVEGVFSEVPPRSTPSSLHT